MSNATLVLEDGRVFKARVHGMDVNKIGKVTLRNNLCSFEHQGEETTFDMDTEAKDFTNINGKLVVDQLPVEYHLYDLKTIV